MDKAIEKLDRYGVVGQVDKSDMLKLIFELPEQCRKAYRLGKEFIWSESNRRVKNIVFAGMGGSAIGADIVRIYLQKELKLAVVVSRNYTLPDFVGKDTLLFCCSYSGNTEETLSSFEDGVRRGASIVTLGSGGKLERFSAEHGFPHIKIPSGYPPRAAVGYMSVTALAVMARLGFVRDRSKDIDEIYSSLTNLRDKEIGIEVPFDRNMAKRLASAVYGKYSIIYGTSDTTEAVSLRWRSQLAENSKTLSSSHVLPEMNHNEIVGWEYPHELLRDFKVIILRDENDHPRTKKRIEISKSIIRKTGAEIFEFERKNTGLLARLFSLIYIGDFVSFYLAILNNTDPTPVKRVDYLKSELASLK